MIEAHNLTKHYGPTRSVEGISFRVEKGEVLGFLGPNGAGKSTTIRMLTGLMRPTAGTASIAGLDVQGEHEKVRRMIGYLPEAAPLYVDMTLASYLQFMGGIKGLDARTAKREMERTTGLVNLEKERPRLLRNLSKGTRQRAALAQALLGDPEVLLLDEPTVGLDPSQINEVRKLVNSFAGRRTVLLSTHILPEVEMTCTRIVIIAGGKIAAAGTPKELTQREEQEYRFAVRGDQEAVAAIAHASAPRATISVAGEHGMVRGTITCPNDHDPRPALTTALVREGMEVFEMRRHEVRLEEIFLEAVGRAAQEAAR